MRRNKLFLGAALAVCGVALASCGAKEERNTKVPYGTLEADLTKTIAKDKYDNKMTLGQYYDRLRYNGYSVVNSAIEKSLYEEEFKAVMNLYNHAVNNTALTEDDYKALKVELKLEKSSITIYDPKDTNDLKELEDDLLEKINTVIATKIFGTAKSKEILVKKENKAEFNKSLNSFVDSQKKLGVDIKAEDIKYNTESEIVKFDNSTLAKLNDAVKAVVLDQAKLLSAMKEYAAIAGQPKITEKDKDGKEKEIKNPDYIDDKVKKAQYDQTFKTYGTYNAIVLQFNSKRDAEKAIEKVSASGIPSDKEAAKQVYIDLYKQEYNYKIGTNEELNPSSPEFVYKVEENVNDFEDLPSQVASFVKDTLKDNEFLIQPRNINNKYILVYKLDTEYTYHQEGSENKQLEYEDLADKEKIDNKIYKNLVKANSSNFQSKDFKDMLEDESTNLKIYDPYFEYKFEYANPEFYEHISKDDYKDNNVIFSIGESVTYTVDDFFKEASAQFANTIINEYFQLEYVSNQKLYDKYVEKQIISNKAHDDNKKALDDALKAFRANSNSTYPAEIGEETFLLASYGYSDYNDVLKYSYDAKAALNAYKTIKVFDEWKDVWTEDGKFKSDATTVDILNNLLKTGNDLLQGQKLFNINIDHFLINIDENGDGTPDNPADFLHDLTKPEQDKFNDAVLDLAKAIINEASADIYKDNTLFETLTYIKGQYEEGAELKSPIDSEKPTWDYYKDYNFLITVEQLASSGDITQDSVNNFVPSFKEYVENVYKSLSTKKDVEFSEDDEKGKFYVVTTGTSDGHKVDQSNVGSLDMNELCATSFGFHVLVVNSYEGPDNPAYDEKDDVSGFQSKIEVILNKYKDDVDKEDSKETTVSVTLSSYNEVSTSEKPVVTMNQFFIYYVQQANGVDSALDSDIKKLMGSLFDSAITTYTSSNFQTYLLLNDLKITLKLDDLSDTTKALVSSSINQIQIDSEKASLKNIVLNYDEENSPYSFWFDEETSWKRPDTL